MALWVGLCLHRQTSEYSAVIKCLVGNTDTGWCANCATQKHGGWVPLAIWIHPVHPPAACCWVFGSREVRWGDNMKGCQATCHRIVMICLCDVWQDASAGGAAGAGHVELVPSPRCLPSCHLSPNYPGLVTSWWIVTPWQPRLAPPLYISYWQVFRGH